MRRPDYTLNKLRIQSFTDELIFLHREKRFSSNRHNKAGRSLEQLYESEKFMNDNAVIKLNATTPQGQEIFLAVDCTARQASVIVVDPRNGNIIVTDVQSIATRGN